MQRFSKTRESSLDVISAMDLGGGTNGPLNSAVIFFASSSDIVGAPVWQAANVKPIANKLAPEIIRDIVQTPVSELFNATKNTILLENEPEGSDLNGTKLSSPHLSLSGTGGSAGAGCREQLSGAGCGASGPMDNLWGHSITYRIAVGPQTGRKVFSLQTLPACDVEESFSGAASQLTGFSLHASVAARVNKREKLDRLRRYIALHGSRVLKRFGTIASAVARRSQRSGFR